MKTKAENVHAGLLKFTTEHVISMPERDVPKPSLADCAQACRWQARDVQFTLDSAKRAGIPPEGYETLVWQIAALERAAKMADAIAECEQQVMDTIRANRRSGRRR